MIRVGFVTPDKGGQRAFLFNHFQGSLCIVDDCLDLAAMPNDACILEQSINIVLGKARDFVEVEFAERRTEVFALDENRALTQPGLKTLQTQFFE